MDGMNVNTLAHKRGIEEHGMLCAFHDSVGSIRLLACLRPRLFELCVIRRGRLVLSTPSKTRCYHATTLPQGVGGVDNEQPQ